MKEYKVSFNNGIWEDIISFKSTASSEQEAVDNVLQEHPEYANWHYLVC